MTAFVEKQITGMMEKLSLMQKHCLKRQFLSFQLKEKSCTKECISTKAREHKLPRVKSIERDIPLKRPRV